MSGLSKKILALTGPILGLAIYFSFDLIPGRPEATFMAGLAVWMAWWWLTESVHFAITALLPLIFLPLSGISEFTDTGAEYFDRIIFVFAGGFVIAMGMEKWNLHTRLALSILSVLGGKPHFIVFGTMLSAFLLSMWISNTATVMSMLPAVLAIVSGSGLSESTKGFVKFRAALLIGLSYAASIGGMATLVGTPTNMIFYGKYTKLFPESTALDFGSWFAMAFPISLSLLIACFGILYLLFLRGTGGAQFPRQYFRDEKNKLGPPGRNEKIIAVVFLVTALLWFSRSGLTLGSVTLPGWGKLIPWPFLNHDFLPAVVLGGLLLVIPSKKNSSSPLVTLRDARKLPFDIMVLFGGGFALASGIEASGLSNWLADGLSWFSSFPSWAFIGAMCLLICIISEVASNVACIQLMLPVLIALYPKLGLDPLFLFIPATLSASLGFMLPVATAPNTIVFGTRQIGIRQMASAGLLMDIAGVILITLFMYLYF